MEALFKVGDRVLYKNQSGLHILRVIRKASFYNLIWCEFDNGEEVLRFKTDVIVTPKFKGTEDEIQIAIKMYAKLCGY